MSNPLSWYDGQKHVTKKGIIRVGQFQKNMFKAQTDEEGLAVCRINRKTEIIKLLSGTSNSKAALPAKSLNTQFI